MGTPTKDDLLAAAQIAVAGFIAFIAKTFAEAPSAEIAVQMIAAYAAKTFAPEAINRIASGLPQELVAAILTGQSEVHKPPSSLS